jgi:hypothetical protein
VVLHLVGPGEGSTISALGSTYTTKMDGEATGGAYSLVEEKLWGDPTPLHLHSREEEAFYVLSGRYLLFFLPPILGGEPRPISNRGQQWRSAVSQSRLPLDC